MRYEKELVGYDARIHPNKVACYWDDSRKTAYLTRMDVNAPLSIDSIVWPSIFDYEPIAIGMDNTQRKQLGLTGYSLPEWIGPNAPFWSSLDELRNYVKSVAQQDEYVIISAYKHKSVRNVAGSKFDYQKAENIYSMRFLGYDIVDEGFLSGVSNCSLDGQYKKDQRKWLSSLNEYHLFELIEDAFDYKSFIEEAVPEHTPFDVCSLWMMAN